MKPYFVKTPSLLKFLFKNWIWSFSAKKKELYLTFDDGPTPEITSWVLNELYKFEAKGTFFCLGKNIAAYPKIYQKIIANNHAVGNHTFNHLNGFEIDTKTYLEDVVEFETLVNNHPELTANNPKLFRPPYGKMKLSQAKEIRKKGYKIIMWDVLSADFDTTISVEKCLENVIRNTSKGSIIVFHDSLKAKEKLQYVLPKVLEYYTKKGYKFKTIT
jgi:peptidoglycan/xylan/chitin deacetylase (PgdA/CDA1 family)